MYELLWRAVAQDPDISITHSLPGVKRAVTETDLEPLLRWAGRGDHRKAHTVANKPWHALG